MAERPQSYHPRVPFVKGRSHSLITICTIFRSFFSSLSSSLWWPESNHVWKVTERTSREVVAAIPDIRSYKIATSKYSTSGGNRRQLFGQWREERRGEERGGGGEYLLNFCQSRPQHTAQTSSRQIEKITWIKETPRELIQPGRRIVWIPEESQHCYPSPGQREAVSVYHYLPAHPSSIVWRPRLVITIHLFYPKTTLCSGWRHLLLGQRALDWSQSG